MKKFELGFMVGRFQILHKGHESLINEGLERCKKFVILLGNSEESRTEKNPFTFQERKEMIHKRGPKKNEPLDDYNKGLRSGYLLAQSDHAGMYKYVTAIKAGKTPAEARAISKKKGK